MKGFVQQGVMPPVPQPGSTLLPALLAELLGGCLVLFASGYAALGWAPALGRADAAPEGARPSAVLGLLIAGLGLMFVGYLFGLRAAGRVRPSLTAILAATTLLAIPMLLLVTMPGGDIYHYTFYGRIDALYGGNPYTDSPEQFQHDRFAQQAEDHVLVLAHGPVWQLATRIVAGVASEDAGPAYFVAAYRLIGLATLLLCSVVTWFILGRLHPLEQARGTWLFAANPICLVELVGTGNHAGLVMLLLLLGVLAQLRGRTVTTFVCCGLAGLTNWSMLVLVPAYLVWIFAARGFRRRATRQLLQGTVLIALLAAGLYGQHWAGMQTIRAISSSLAPTHLENSLAAWIERRVDPGAGMQSSQRSSTVERVLPGGESEPMSSSPSTTAVSSIRVWIVSVFDLAFVAWALVLLARVHDPRTLLKVWGWTLFAYVSLACVSFWPWYVVWVLALGALVPGTALARASVLLSATSLLIIIGRAVYVAAGARIDPFLLGTFLPPLIYAALSHLRRRGIVPSAGWPAPVGSRR